MRAVVQRVSWAKVEVDGQIVGEIGPGLLVLLGAGDGDNEQDNDYLRQKIIALRVFEDAAGKMNRSLTDVGGALLVVSQFTLYGDCRKGRRPSFAHALAPAVAEQLYDQFIAACRRDGIRTECGRFGAKMAVSLLNDGPVTLLLDSRRAF